MKSFIVVLWLAIIALIVLLGSCEKPRMFVQDGMYIDSAKCKTIVIRDGQLVTGHKTISGCVFRVSDLIKERDSLQDALINCPDVDQWIPAYPPSEPSDAGPYPEDKLTEKERNKN